MQSSTVSDQSSLKQPLSQASPTNTTLLPPTSSPSSNAAENNSPDSGIAIGSGSQSFCSGDSVSPPAQGPADSTSLFQPSTVASMTPSPRKTMSNRVNSLPQLSSRINPALITGQPTSLTPPPHMMAPYNSAEMAYYPTRRTQQQPSSHFPLNHTTASYHTGPPPYSSYPPPYGSSGVSGHTYPPSYGTLPYYNQNSGTAVSSVGYPNSGSSLSAESGYMSYEQSQPAPTAPAVSAMLPAPTSRPPYVSDAPQTESGIFSGSYSTANTTISSPCSSTHSETVPANRIENTYGEFVTSAPVTLSPTASLSPPATAASHHSPSLETQQSMDVDCISNEGGSVGGVGSDAGFRQPETNKEEEETATEDLNMTERCVFCVFMSL